MSGGSGGSLESKSPVTSPSCGAISRMLGRGSGRPSVRGSSRARRSPSRGRSPVRPPMRVLLAQGLRKPVATSASVLRRTTSSSATRFAERTVCIGTNAPGCNAQPTSRSTQSRESARYEAAFRHNDHFCNVAKPAVRPPLLLWAKAAATPITPALTRSSSGRRLGRHPCSGTDPRVWARVAPGRGDTPGLVPMRHSFAGRAGFPQSTI